jgi:hypothetical protein
MNAKLFFIKFKQPFRMKLENTAARNRRSKIRNALSGEASLLMRHAPRQVGSHAKTRAQSPARMIDDAACAFVNEGMKESSRREEAMARKMKCLMEICD